MTEQLQGTTGDAKHADDSSQLFGRYRVLRTLAFGGMAQILLAADQRTGRLVVLKKILPHYAENSEFVQFFIHEGRLGQRLRHHNLVETLEAGKVGNVPYIALEYLRGKPAIELLRHAARQHVEVPLGVAVRIVADAARGLHHAHTATDQEGRPLNVVHRDVTPHNLYVCADGSTKVLDFGIAKAASQLHHTRTGTIKGKFAYLAPEQVKGDGNIDHRVDVFALGIVLHELLTLKPLFRGAHDGETLQRVLTFEVPAPERIRPGVPPGLGAVALRALQRDRDRRLPSAQALADSIEAVAAAEGIDASPDAVRELLERLFPNPEDLGESEAPRVVVMDAGSPSLSTQPPKETPPRGVDPLDDAAVPIEVAELPTAPLKGHAAAPAVTSTQSRAVHRRRTGRAALLVAAASVAVAVALGSSTCLRRAAAPSPGATTPQAKSTRGEAPLGVGGGPRSDDEAAPQGSPALPSPTTPAIADRAAEATLRVQTDGAASFVVDGRPLRPASDGALHLPPGRHTVVVTGASLAFPRTLVVELKPNEAALRSVHGGKGQLRVAVTPWAEVIIDGKSLGVTPLQPAELTEGSHLVTLKNGDLGVTTKRRITIVPNRESLLRVDLFAEKKGG